MRDPIRKPCIQTASASLNPDKEYETQATGFQDAEEGLNTCDGREDCKYPSLLPKVQSTDYLGTFVALLVGNKRKKNRKKRSKQ